MSADSQYMEHRWGTRIALDVPVEIEFAGGSSIASVRNASVSGAYLETTWKPPMLSRVVLGRRSLRPGVRLDACVVRIDRHGIALEWVEPGLRAMAELLALRKQPALAPEMAAPLLKTRN